MKPRRLFALDQNFPVPLCDALKQWLPADLVSVREIDPQLAEADDWELLQALHRDPRPWDGLITSDDSMLKLPKEMVVLSQTGLTLIVAKGEGHNPIKAVGVVLCHLGHICHQTDHRRPQIWTLNVSQKKEDRVDDYLEEIARRTGTTVKGLLDTHRLSPAEMEYSISRSQVASVASISRSQVASVALEGTGTNEGRATRLGSERPKYGAIVIVDGGRGAPPRHSSID
jgi:hypothetical protein